MFAEGAPPMYCDLDGEQALPLYSVQCPGSEHVLQAEAPRVTGCPACEWIFDTKHMKINFGSRMWRSSSPCYGLNGSVDGIISFSGENSRVKRVTISLEGRLKMTLALSRNKMPTVVVIPLIAQTVVIYDASKGGTFPWDQEHTFSIPIPADVDIRGRTIRLPPSHYSVHQHISCEISYFTIVRMERKGSGLKNNELKKVPIFYLPKSHPSASSSNNPTQQLPEITETLGSWKPQKSTALVPYCPLDKKGAVNLNRFSECCFLALPTPLCFAAGQVIPFRLALDFGIEPVYAQLLTQNVRVQIVKRLIFWLDDGPVKRDIFVSWASIRYEAEYREGIVLLNGQIRAGEVGKEQSWKVDGVAELQYIFRAILKPPTHLASHVPSFRHEEVIQLTTDSFGSVYRELTSTGRTSTPAVGLMMNLRRSS